MKEGLHQSADAELVRSTVMKQHSLATSGFELRSQRTRKRAILHATSVVQTLLQRTSRSFLSATQKLVCSME
jgi:hypothetical protein